MIEHYVGQGHQVFAISWRNPEQAQGHFDLDTYADAVAQARDAAASITEQSKVHLAAACSGGIVTAGLVGQLAASGELGEIASLTLMVCALDNDTEGTMSALASRDVAAAAVAESARKGYLDGQALQGVFTWLRPNDLVWNYVVNNYLLGKDPPAFDILYWNQDTVRLSAGLHRDFIHIGLDNSFTRPVRSRCSASRSIWAESTWTRISSRASPITSSRGRARTTERALFGGERRFVLSRQRSHPSAGEPSAPERRTRARATASPKTLPGPAEEFLAQAPQAVGELVVGLGRVAGGALR